MKKIIVLGGGPAGVVCALGLKKLGYEVVLVTKKRPFEAIEGFSKRTLEGLKRANCHNALATIGAYIPRRVEWNKKRTQSNYEYIVHRKDFDEALLEDAKANDIKVIKQAGKILDENKGLVEVNKKLLKADFIVDARGRFAPRRSEKHSKNTTAFLITYKQRNTKLQTSLETTPYGWVWQAQDGNNMNYLQLTTESKLGKGFLKELLKQSHKTKLLNNKITMREASSYVSKELVKKRSLRIGDAACAVDPLSGNGVFQALSTALIAPYVVHTLLYAQTSDQEAAKRFFTTRVHDIFYRYTRMGREFYQMEQQHKTKFWKDRSLWPDLKESHTKFKEPYIKEGSVLIAPFIKKNEVVITPDNPLGVWKMGEVDLVELVKTLLPCKKEQRLRLLIKYCSPLKLKETQKSNLLFWCQKNRLIS